MRCSILILFIVAASLFAQQSPVPEIRYRSVPDFLKLPPDLYFGEVAGVAVNSKGHVFVFSRGNTTGPAYGASAAQLLEFGADGKFVREIGHNLYAWSYAHTVKVDREDNIWVTDKGSDMVIKFNPEGRVVMVFGRKQEASDDGTLHYLPRTGGTNSTTLTSATATLIRESPRSTKMANGSNPGVSLEANPDSSILRIALHSTLREMSTWRIAVTGESKCSMETESSCAKSPSTCLSIIVLAPQSGTSANSRTRQGLRVHLGRSALHLRRIK